MVELTVLGEILPLTPGWFPYPLVSYPQELLRLCVSCSPAGSYSSALAHTRHVSHVLNSRRPSQEQEKKKGMNTNEKNLTKSHEQCSVTGGGQLTKVHLCET